ERVELLRRPRRARDGGVVGLQLGALDLPGVLAHGSALAGAEAAQPERPVLEALLELGALVVAQPVVDERELLEELLGALARGALGGEDAVLLLVPFVEESDDVEHLGVR